MANNLAENYHVNTIAYPGTTFLDYDCESTASYDGYHLGSTSVLGYSEEYREYQLAQKLQLQLHLLSQNVPPAMELDAIVQRLQQFQGNPNLEDNAKQIGRASCRERV